ncbi:MAG: hypothetical protein JWO78_481 [Micavibrio sp.]|nr:hypothetical protein [Micavibrio sp.]
MEPIVAYRLNEIFKDWAANKSMQRMETSISVKTLSGASLEIKPTSPAEAAEYLHELLTTKNRLFRPGVHRAPSSQTTHAERQE